MKTNAAHPPYLANNAWQIPDLHPQPHTIAIPPNLRAYTYRQPIPAHTNALIHFHIDDYRFESVWNYPQRGLSAVQKNAWAVCSPDFSLWADMPLAQQIWNIYRARWTARYWQEAGLTIIPTINWSTPESWNFCFVGIPRNQIVTLRTPKRFSNTEWTNFYSGYQQMLQRITPQTILWFANRIPYHCLKDNIPKLQFPTTTIRQQTKGAATWAVEAAAAAA